MAPRPSTGSSPSLPSAHSRLCKESCQQNTCFRDVPCWGSQLLSLAKLCSRQARRPTHLKLCNALNVVHRQQAAEQGDADKVGKKRRKSKAAAEEDQVFGEERTAADRAAALRETGRLSQVDSGLETAPACPAQAPGAMLLAGLRRW